MTVLHFLNHFLSDEVFIWYTELINTLLRFWIDWQTDKRRFFLKFIYKLYIFYTIVSDIVRGIWSSSSAELKFIL